jgi:hypothetical protein
LCDEEDEVGVRFRDALVEELIEQAFVGDARGARIV